eukprot:290068_1
MFFKTKGLKYTPHVPMVSIPIINNRHASYSAAYSPTHSSKYIESDIRSLMSDIKTEDKRLVRAYLRKHGKIGKVVADYCTVYLSENDPFEIRFSLQQGIDQNFMHAKMFLSTYLMNISVKGTPNNVDFTSVFCGLQHINKGI